MAAISRDDVAHLAKLARIEMTPAELDHMATELEQILGAVKRVQEVATSDIAPTSHPLSMSNVFRDDVVKPRLTKEASLSGAPAKAEDRYKVPQILGEE
jgi:aspartyl-tRNA(Asn)/glutamyl-tRNA(Gln) amidotransferase subunit C